MRSATEFEPKNELAERGLLKIRLSSIATDSDFSSIREARKNALQRLDGACLVQLLQV
jgi:hypothetical protein